jgi:glycosyltransferase involved in cell wall biosynthesis
VIQQEGEAGSPYKIVMVAASPFPYPQGSQVLIGQLAAALQRRGHRVQLVTYHFGIGQAPEGVVVHRSRPLPGGRPVQARPSWQKPLLDLLLAGELLRTVRRCRPDVLHTHNFEGLLAALFVRCLTGVPVVYHVHNAMGLELHTYFGSRLGRWAGGVVGRWVDAHLARRADYCIVLTQAAVGYFQQRGVERLGLIPPGIDLGPGSAAAVRAQWGAGPLVLYSGNLDRYQDLDLLLRAFRLVAGARPDARLVFSTNGAPDECRALAGELGLGRQLFFVRADDFYVTRGLLAAADVAVCPRLICLGFPIKLLNYMAAGVAIVASAGSACGLRHLENGWVVADGDAAGMASAMAAAILALLDDPALARRLGEQARETAQRDYGWERAAAAIEDVYKQVGPAGKTTAASPATRRER